jgi:hypothetical protein
LLILLTSPSRYSHIHNTNKHYSPLPRYSLFIMTNKRFSQASTLVGDTSDQDTALSIQPNSHPRPRTPDRNRVNRRAGEIPRPTAASGSRQIFAGQTSQASGLTTLNRQTIRNAKFADRMLLPVSLNSNSRASQSDRIPEPRVALTETTLENRKAKVYWKPANEVSIKHA